jgi:hypothetical protein
LSSIEDADNDKKTTTNELANNRYLPGVEIQELDRVPGRVMLLKKILQKIMEYQ